MKLNLKENKKHRLAAVTTLSILLGCAVVVIAGVSYAYAYDGRFFPGSTVAGMPLGGMTYPEGLALVNARADQLINEGAQITINGSTRTIPLRLLSPDDPDLAQDLVALNAQPVVQAAFDRGRSGNLAVRAWDMARIGLAQPNDPIEVGASEEAIEASLLDTFAEYYDPAEEPSFDITEEDGAWKIEVVEGHDGRAFDLDEAVNAFTTMMAYLNNENVAIAVVDESPSLSTEDAESLMDQVQAILDAAPLVLEYEVNRFEDYSYELDVDTLASNITLVNTKGDGPQLSIAEDLEIFETMVEEIDVLAEDARFARGEDGRVQEFQPSVEGREVNVGLTRAKIMSWLNGSFEEEAEEAVTIVVENSAPDVATRDVNNLGITEILGEGTSTYHGSPTNRIKNIANATQKLNGLLIGPGEEFSMVQALEPITLANGYLPEMVIKGDEIKPEVGGGLCQIGTTAFRAAMNSGQEISERRNHSLVVNYYNDPSNGNPGTDATIYGPHPDMRFVNTTDDYILLEAINDVPNRKLTYRLWGTNDGRKGYYSPPVVHSWTPTGPSQTKYTTELAPGVRRCQSSHPGATTSFTYYIERADGTVDEEVFESYYRPLPTICLEGVAPEQLDEDGNLIEPEPEAETLESSEDSETTTEETMEEEA